MYVTKHAVKRYKQRVGKKSASHKRIVRTIQSQVKNANLGQSHEYYGGKYCIYTDKFIAGCIHNTVCTILSYHHEDPRDHTFDDFIYLNEFGEDVEDESEEETVICQNPLSEIS